MASNLYDSPLVSGISNSNIKLDPTAFYTPTSFPQSSNNLQQQAQLQPQQQEQQFYSHTASNSYGNLNDSFISIESPPPLEPDLGSNMNPYMGNGGYSNLPLASQYGDYYATASDGYGAQQQIPRSLEYNLMLQYNVTPHSHPSSLYHQSPVPSPHSSHHGLLIDNEWYRESHRASLSRSHSPHDLRQRQATASIKDEGEEIEETKAELPYAKLIHKALMEAPNHAMSLQDIYKWFIENTDKGQSTGSGWRNSIRHNLSMNQAFRKSDKNSLSSPSDGTPKKTSEWVLEPWAVADGVTPTTRYRAKVAKKASHRDASTINTSRQSAGKKGGNMAGRAKALRSREMDRVRSQQGSREASVSRDYEIDYYGRGSKRQCTSEAFTGGRNSPPMEDPITPTAQLSSGPYYYAAPSHGYNDMEKSQYSLDQVQGVYEEDLYSGPVFSQHAVASFGTGEVYGSWVTTE